MPADARKTRLVRVLCTSKAYYNDGSPRVPVNDLDYMHWVNVHVDWPTHFLEPNNQNFVVERFPPEARAPSPFRYVVFMSHWTAGFFQQFGRPNTLLRSLHGAGGLDVKGSILVAKCDVFGSCIPVETTDIGFIETIRTDLSSRGRRKRSTSQQVSRSTYRVTRRRRSDRGRPSTKEGGRREETGYEEY